MSDHPKSLLISSARIAIASVFGRSIIAIELETGGVLWRQNTSGRPVAVTGGSLVVLENDPDLRLVIRDLQSGTLTAQTSDLSFPDWIGYSAAQLGAVQFSASEEAGHIVIDWQTSQRYYGGAAPPSEFISQNSPAGRVKIDLETGGQQTETIEASISSMDPLVEDPAVEAEFDESERLTGEVERAVDGDEVFVLRAEQLSGGGLSARLSALGGDRRTVAWEAELGRTETPARAAPLRK